MTARILDPTKLSKGTLHMRAWRAANPERVAAANVREKVKRDANRETHRARHSRNRTGWLPGAYDAAFKSQNGMCALCLQPMRHGGVSKLSAVRDHHEPEGIKTPRALLHQECNQKLGYLENPIRLSQAFTYLAKYGSAALGIK